MLYYTICYVCCWYKVGQKINTISKRVEAPLCNNQVMYNYGYHSTHSTILKSGKWYQGVSTKLCIITCIPCSIALFSWLANDIMWKSQQIVYSFDMFQYFRESEHYFAAENVCVCGGPSKIPWNLGLNHESIRRICVSGLPMLVHGWKNEDLFRVPYQCSNINRSMLLHECHES
jgi:hypothetical protein